MELIIKPTELCNFKCTFCSSTHLTDTPSRQLDVELIFAFLTRYPNTSTIVVNGGDPLMVSPSYYWKIIEYLDDNNLKTDICLTTNLWAFYKKPDMWIELFKHPRIHIGTSFNYGDTRRVTNDLVYTEDLFWKVSDMMLERVGYRPGFISVITDENEDTAIDNVRLAQRMDVECKLNYALASGAQSAPYLLSKIYKLYIDVYNLGLAPWEFNTKQMMIRLQGMHTMCPQNRNCDEHIRCLQPDGDYYSCGAMGDDKKYPINFFKEVIVGTPQRPLQQPELLALKEECLTCDMFLICNGCKKTIMDLKNHNLVEPHCTLMKSIAPTIKEISDGTATARY